MSPEREHTRFVGSGTTPSPGFYVGLGMFALLLVAAALVLPAPRRVIDQHANPTPAGKLPAQVFTSPGSNLYHAGTACPYAHKHASSVATALAVDQGLVPCPYCIGNSSAHLTPAVVSQRNQ